MSESDVLDLEKILKEGLDVSPDSFGVFDQNQILIYCNSTFSGIFDVTNEEAIGSSHMSLLQASWQDKKGVKIECDDFSDWFKRLERLFDEKKMNQFEADLRDGRWFKMTRMNLASGYMVLFGVDITELKEAQKNLEEANKKIQTLANTDQLTGLYNRRAFNSMSDNLIAEVMQGGQSFSLLLIDFDLFKEVNDQFGHDAGDKVLREFSTISKVFFGQYEILCRIGGEEFVVIVPDTDLEAAYQIAERFRSLVASHSFYLDSSHQHIQMSVSIGLAKWLVGDKGIKDPLQRADAALYKAKNAGRNQVLKSDVLD